MNITKLLPNCFLLLIPVFVWNLIFYNKLPAMYQNEKWDDIPKFIDITENILRIIVFTVPLFLKLGFESPIQRNGLILYIAGLVLYFLSWIMQMYFPNTLWSISIFGFTAPAYTVIIWLAGIFLIGRKTTIGIKYPNLVYIIVCLLFTSVHFLHSYIVYRNN